MIVIDPTSIGGNLSITTGAGDDQIGFTDVTVTGTTTINAGDGDNFLGIGEGLAQSSFGGAFWLTTGSGDDAVTLDDSEFYGTLTVQVGGGEDSVQVNWSDHPITTHSTALFDGGIGLDLFIDWGGNTWAFPPVIVGFEGP